MEGEADRADYTAPTSVIISERGRDFNCNYVRWMGLPCRPSRKGREGAASRSCNGAGSQHIMTV